MSEYQCTFISEQNLAWFCLKNWRSFNEKVESQKLLWSISIDAITKKKLCKIKLRSASKRIKFFIRLEEIIAE
jgi:hypothetical protein